ncbi:MAG TPA: MFS transporter [Mucilaginibacter sp.]|jgi:EmrB/QacA subfamily drug resistance transporter|nr:MFS transporter [Mucilaginibacter sp.]
METVALGSRAGKWIMVSSILASSMAFIDGTALNVVLPSLQKSLHATGTDLFWILNAYILMLAALILIGGSLGDKLGRKKVFMVGIFVFICGSAACGFAPDVTWLVIFRAIQGAGGALMIPGSLSLISSSIQPGERGKAIGTWTAFTTVVTIGGPALGGALADAGLWRYIFFINVPLGLAALVILASRVKESRDEGANHKIDYAGAISIVLGLALFTFGFLRIPDLGYRNAQVIVSLVVGFVLLVLFVVIEYRSSHPMMPLKLFANSTFSGANLLTFFLYAGLGAAMLFMSLNMVQVQGYSQLQSGLTFLPFPVLMVGIARRSGAIADKHGPRPLLIIGPAIAGAGFLLLSFIKQTNGASDYWTSFFPGIIVFGLGMAITVAPLTTAVMTSVSDHFSGTASGINNAVSRIAGVFTNAVFGTLAVLFFAGALQHEIAPLPLNPAQKQAVMAQAKDMGNAHVPKNIEPKNKAVIVKSYHNSFIAMYSIILKISAALGFAAALMAFIFIKPDIPSRNTA